MIHNFEKINKELTKQVADYEKTHDISKVYINPNDTSLHNMKVKGKVFSSLELDKEFENADLLDYLGYERIISCKNKNNK